MSTPRISVIPSRDATCADADCTLDLLLLVEPPLPEIHFERPQINLALVIDRSGSMAGLRKMPYAIQAASFAVEQLMPSDRVSVISFDNNVEVEVPSQSVADRAAILQAIGRLSPRGATDLHGGWAAGARQVDAHQIAQGLNRILLLSDGLANEGVTDPTTIATEVSGRASHGISTSTIGLGIDYNEDLMEAMARSGVGNYYFVESPVQLADIFQTELQGLANLVGLRVSLGIEPAPGVEVLDVLNDYQKAPTGRWMLPSLIAGLHNQSLIRLRVRPDHPAGPLVRFRLAWDGTRGDTDRSVMYADIALAAVPATRWQALPINPQVQEMESLLMAARAQREAAEAFDKGDWGTARQLHAQTLQDLQAAPSSEAILAELQFLARQSDNLAQGSDAFAKHAKFRAYQNRQSRPKDPDQS